MTDRERDCRIARGLGWRWFRDAIIHPPVYKLWPPDKVEGIVPDFLSTAAPADAQVSVSIVPNYSDPSQTGPLLEALLEKGWRIWRLEVHIDNGVRIAAQPEQGGDSKHGWGRNLAEAVAELADKVLGVSE